MNVAVVQRIQNTTKTVEVFADGEWVDTEVETTTRSVVGVYALDGGFNPQVFHRAVSEETGIPDRELYSTLMIVNETLHPSLREPAK